MTHDHISEKEKEAPPQTPAERSVTKFAYTYDRFKAGFAPTETNGRTWQELDDESDTLDELKKNPNDPFNQKILEGRWPENEQLDDARRDALSEYFLAEHGEITTDDMTESLKEARRTIHEATQLEKNESSHLIDGMFGTVTERKAVLDFIENSISELNVFIPFSKNTDEKQALERRRDLLRIARIKIDEQYRTYRDIEKDERQTARRNERAEASRVVKEAATDTARTEVAALFDPHPLATPDQLTAQRQKLDEQRAAAQANRDKIAAERAHTHKENTQEPDSTVDSEFQRLKELGLGSTKEEQARNIEQSRIQRQKDEERDEERRLAKAEKERQATVIKKGEADHKKSTSQKRNEEEALLAVYEALHVADVPTELKDEPTEEILAKEHAATIVPEKKKIERTPEEIAEREARLQREKLKIKQSAVRVAVEILRQVPRPIKEQLINNADADNPLLSSAMEAFEVAIDTSKIDPNRVRHVEAKLRTIGVLGATPAGPNFWQEVEYPRGSGELPRLAQETRDALSDLLKHLQEAQKDAAK